ncbi:trichohyalin-like [Aedes albopictus]|uniref:CCHC-type domain-containing protein n=1 Tax=Aedes albopictus TaxID=7160 RepID=A0ABM1ZX93_AEDAL
MAVKLPHADHLINEEVDYELSIRGKFEDINNDVEAKYRMLRYLFKEDEKERREYESPYTIDQEFDIICSRVDELRNKLVNGLDDRCFSRLKHYWGRVYRIRTNDAESERMRKELLIEIRAELSKFEGRKELEVRPDPFNFEGAGKTVNNGAKQKELGKTGSKQDTGTETSPITPVGTNVEYASERERALEAQVKELHQKLDLLLRGSEGAKGGDEESGKESVVVVSADRIGRRDTGPVGTSELRDERRNRRERWEESPRGSVNNQRVKQAVVNRKVAEGRETGNGDRQSVERGGYYRQESRNGRTTNDHDSRRGTALEQIEGHHGWNSQRNQPGGDRSQDERMERPNDGFRHHGTRQSSQRMDADFDYRPDPEYEIRDQWRERTRRSDGYDGRGRYQDQQFRPLFRDEQFGRSYQEYQPDVTWRQQQRRQRDTDQRRFDENGDQHRYQGERFRRVAGSVPRLQLDYSSDESSVDEGRWSRDQGRPNRSFRRVTEAEIRDADRRMEKWHLSFSGDARSRSLEDFLLKVRRLAKMDRIADDVLMQRIHTILRGEAYDWYLCYADEFHDWKHFEERIRYMYGNPNKDQGNRQKIYERKQNRNETFLSFKMEIERLNKLLSTPLDPQRIFEVIWDNMRPHYRSKLACKTVESLRKLEHYAYRIDANDPVFRNVRETPSKPIHNIEVEQKEDESYSSASESEHVNAIGSRFDKDRRYRDQRSAGTNGRNQESPRETPSSTQIPMCWNCRKSGHLWRNCPEEKRLFCYLCGTQGKTVTTCDKHSGEARAQQIENSGN